MSADSVSRARSIKTTVQQSFDRVPARELPHVHYEQHWPYVASTELNAIEAALPAIIEHHSGLPWQMQRQTVAEESFQRIRSIAEEEAAAEQLCFQLQPKHLEKMECVQTSTVTDACCDSRGNVFVVRCHACMRSSLCLTC